MRLIRSAWIVMGVAWRMWRWLASFQDAFEIYEQGTSEGYCHVKIATAGYSASLAAKLAQAK